MERRGGNHSVGEEGPSAGWGEGGCEGEGVVARFSYGSAFGIKKEKKNFQGNEAIKVASTPTSHWGGLNLQKQRKWEPAFAGEGKETRQQQIRSRKPKLTIKG